MGTIAALEKDVFAQVPALSEISLPEPLGPRQQARAVFCGSGDSLAACMLAEAFSGYAVQAADPLDLLKNPRILKNKDAYVVSISGKTISNIRAARNAKKSIAITSNPDSRLGKACDKTIHLNIPNSDVITAGTISFLNSALVCMALVFKFKIKNAQKIFDDAVTQSKKTPLSGRVFFLGNLHTYPLAMYAAAKTYEILGFDAFYERIEQFSHMELFSAKKGDTVIIFEEHTRHNSGLAEHLRRLGLRVFRPAPKQTGKISQFLFYTFFSQLVPLLIAKQGRKKDCHFVTAQNLRHASDKMIY